MTAIAPSSTYTALHNAAVLVPRHDRLRMTFAGDKAKEALGGLVTSDVTQLAPGAAQRSVALTPKGRVIAMIRVMDRGTDMLVDCEPSAADGFAAMIKKFVNPRLAKYTVVTDTTGCLGVYGPQAAEHLAAVSHADVLTIPSSDFGVPGFDLIGERDTIEEIHAALEARGVPVADAETLEIAAVEAGIPRFGIEMDGETIPQEANLDALDAMSFNKGCFTGQEVVARIHFRGHVNRHLRRLRSEALLARGATVMDAEGKEVGDVRSAVVSPTQGPIAIAMVRREVELGTVVTARHGTESVTARVEALA